MSRMLLVLAVLTGCGGAEAPNTPSPMVPPEATTAPVGEATAPTGQTGRDRHRMSVPQLADSLARHRTALDGPQRRPL